MLYHDVMAGIDASEHVAATTHDGFLPAPLSPTVESHGTSQDIGDWISISKPGEAQKRLQSIAKSQIASAAKAKDKQGSQSGTAAKGSRSACLLVSVPEELDPAFILGHAHHKCRHMASKKCKKFETLCSFDFEGGSRTILMLTLCLIILHTLVAP